MITVWHPMRQTERDVLYEEFRRFEKLHPEHPRPRPVQGNRKSSAAASRRRRSPARGPISSTARPTCSTRTTRWACCRTWPPGTPTTQRADFIKGALTYLPALVDPTKHDLVQVGDRFGNHLSLIYNRRFVTEPPKTTDELIALATANTLDDDGDGRKERYGLVWSFVEPYFAIPFLTGHGAWVFAEPATDAGSARPCRRSIRPKSVAAYDSCSRSTTSTAWCPATATTSWPTRSSRPAGPR